MVNKFIRLTVVLVLSLLVFSSSDTPALANIGSHLGEGDINGQISIMEMLAANGAEGNFPVTLMIGAKTSERDLERLAETVHKHNFFPIARVNGVCNVNPNQAKEQVNKIRRIFGSGTVITFGNEVNNPRECSNPERFKENYLALDYYDRLSPSALDFYNSQDKATDFLDETNMQSQYRNAPVRTANAYGCTDTDINGCNPLTTDTVKIGTQIIGEGSQISSNKLYLTEFSLSPNGDNAPDTDLDQVRTFIETRGPQTGAIHITPLVRNVCENLQNEGQWLVYLHGDFYTRDGTRVLPENCEALDRANPYEQKTRDLSQYYLYPLKLQPEKSFNGTGSEKDVYIWNLVKDQGYRVYKPSPQLTLTQFTRGSFEDFLTHLQRNGVEHHIFSATDGFDIDLAEGRIPLFRGTESEDQTEKISSFEGYFGSNSPSSQNIVDTGVAHSLLSRDQQCALKIKNLKTIKQMCQVLDGDQTLQEPETCAYHKKVPLTDYYLFSTETGSNSNHKSLLTAIQDSGLSCDHLTQNYHSSFPVDEETFIEIQTALESMDLNIDRAYRWAFLVIAPLMNPDGGNQPSSCQIGTGEKPGDNFCFLWRHKGSEGAGAAGDVSQQHWINRPEHAPIFVALKIPDFGTHHSQTFDYRDSAQLTADVLLKKDQRKKLEKNLIEKKKDELLDSINIARTYKEDPDARASLPIFCDGMPMCDCAHGSCPIRQALVDIINGSYVSRYGFNSEPDPHVIAEEAGDIYTPAGAKEDVSRIFTKRFHTEDIFNLTSSDDSDTAGDSWKWGLKVYSDDSKQQHNDEQQTTVGVFIVAPINNEYSTLHYLSESLKVFFSQRQLGKMIENNCVADGEGKCGELPLFYPIKEAEFNFKSSDLERFHNPDKIGKCPCRSVIVDGKKTTPENCANSQRTKCKNDRAGIKEDIQAVGLFYPGAKFGWYVRKIQQTLHQAGGVAHDYISSCKRTEDLFLGRCGSQPEKYGSPDGVPYNGGEGVGEGWSAGECQILTEGPCSVENLETKIANWPGNQGLSGVEITKRAKQASIICNAESGGSASAINRGCQTGDSVDYSVGLFQINLLAHACPHYFEYSWEPPQCTLLVDQDKVDSCAENVLHVDTNIRYALSISSGGSNWDAWATAGEKYCGPTLDSIRLD